VCHQAKQTRNVFPLSNNKYDFPLDMVHYDIRGPYKTPSTSGAHYFLIIVDDCSRCTWVYLLKHMSEAHKYFIQFHVMVNTQFNWSIKIVRSVNGLEFTVGYMFKFFSQNGISHQTSCVDTPQQNGIVKRKHRHLLKVACAFQF
jgi:transposase InsO family protein